jgi:pyruvate carboxylase subunit B
MKYHVSIGSREIEVDLREGAVRVDGEEVKADLEEMDGTEVKTLLLDGVSYRVLANRAGPGRWNLHLPGRPLSVEVMDERARAIRAMTPSGDGRKGSGSLRAPMPGLVVKVEVAEGDEVAPGQGILIVEAMKMENELKSDGHLRVTRITVSPGDAVEKDQVLVEFEPV